MNLNAKESKSNSIIFSTEDRIVMGILNITKDSFYDGGRYINNQKIIARCKSMLEEGAAIIDIGAQSSRPGAIQVSSRKELEKLIPTIKLLKNTFKDITISVDTFWSNTAKECIRSGANIINDISAGEKDKNMFSTITELNVPYIIMHMQGTPQNMQKKPSYNNITKEIITYFKNKINQLHKAGFHKIIIDPGFGFGKTLRHNILLLKSIEQLKYLKVPICVGISRKSFIGKITNKAINERLYGSLGATLIALQNGANIIRTHDVGPTTDIINLYNSLNNI